LSIRTRDDTRSRVRGEAQTGSIESALRRALEGDVRADPYTRHLYAADASMYAVTPLLVAFPRSADDVAAAVEIAGAHGVPVVSRGGGTSLAGQAAGGRGIVLDHSRHRDAIGEIDVANRRVRVEPGVVQEALNRAAKPHGLGFGPDTSTANRATLGGMIGNNSSGSASILHGTTIDHVLELEVVLADGSRATFGQGGGAARAGTLEHAIRHGMPGIVERHARAIAEDYPKHWRQSGG
jgi:FAD/FMN-containing dehydrogenase